MSNEADTDIIRAKSPLLYAVLSFILKRLEVIALAGLAYWMAHSHEQKDVGWIQNHLQQKQAEIEQLKETK
jgi:hypothetical protein